MKNRKIIRHLGWTTLALLGCCANSFAASSAVLGWNNLGMHCMDSDYSVFSILPPYNTIEAQLIVNGQLVKSGTGYTVTYEAVADPDGSVNSTAIGKGNFYTYTAALYGPLAPDMGLAGWALPGINNTPQSMLFELNNSPAAGVSAPVNWFRAEGIPLSPYDDAMQVNQYPLMRLVARNSARAVVASSDIVLPVSDEMDCRICHASGGQAAAQPFNGWVTEPNPERNYRLNILRLHDDHEFLLHPANYSAALAARGFSAAGLYTNVVINGRPVLCAACHTSEALQGSGIAGVPPLTTSIHSLHASVRDPILNVTLNDSANRAACYLCHPGSTTKCLRGAMGSAVAADGSMEMQCQSCHGSMSQVGSPDRVGWFMEPACQSCHTGTATRNNGQIRYASVFTDAIGTVRVPVDQTFATTPNTPAAGLSLYRFSVGHGGLQCSACHGSTHAEFPSAFRNDNIESQQLQGHVGVIAECTACHVSMPNTVNGGPHGMHPIGSSWVSQHHDYVGNGGGALCQACHGTDYRGTVLSLMQAPRTLDGQALFRGAIVGCYLCHNGPGGDGGSPGAAPTVANVSASTTVGQPVAITLPATGANLSLRIISQSVNGSVGLIGGVATYFPAPGFVGTDTFTFAAYNGAKNSTLATGTITVGGGGGAVGPVITTQPVTQTVSAGTTVNFTVTATGTAPLSYQWQKDGVNLPGATSATLTLVSVTASSAGGYRAVVSNVVSTATSAVASLTVGSGSISPSITLQPVGQVVLAGTPVVFTVVATGTAPLSYQWQKNGASIAGASSASLTLNNVTTADAGTYAVVVRNLVGFVTSANAVLVVNPVSAAPSITLQPASQTVAAGGTATFTVNATGSAPLSYQWLRNGNNIAGATSAVLTLNNVTSASAGNYQVRIRNGAGSVTSATATLTVTVATLTIRLTSPSEGARYSQSAEVRLAASVTTSANVARVQFFDGTSLLGTDRSAPFSITARNLGSGAHILTAQVTTLSGLTATSDPVRITVGNRSNITSR